MKGIKFRVWDFEEKKFKTNVGLDVDGDLILLYPGIGEYDSVGKYKKFDIQLFTGSKDKNGKDVYEDDIVLFSNFGYDPSNGENPCSIGTILFHDNQFTIDKKYIHEIEIEELEVIGNIHENPERLEKE